MTSDSHKQRQGQGVGAAWLTWEGGGRGAAQHLVGIRGGAAGDGKAAGLWGESHQEGPHRLVAQRSISGSPVHGKAAYTGWVALLPVLLHLHAHPDQTPISNTGEMANTFGSTG